MPHRCILCRDNEVFSWEPFSYICKSCYLDLEPGRNTTAVTGLFAYHDRCRELVHRAKIRCETRSLQAIAFLLTESASANKSCAWASHICPSPSSLWSRLKGKFDIAHVVGHQMARRFEKPLIAPPFSLRWNLRKQSFRKAGRRQSIAEAAPGILTGMERRILLVDDVVTTGGTRARVSAAFPGDEVRLLSFADARPNES